MLTNKHEYCRFSVLSSRQNRGVGRLLSPRAARRRLGDLAIYQHLDTLHLSVALERMTVRRLTTVTVAAVVSQSKRKFSWSGCRGMATSVKGDVAVLVHPIHLPGDILDLRRRRILQMDIEGAEYRVIAATTVETLSRFRIIVVEFHELSNLFTKFGFREISNAFRKLLLTHRVVHIHPNNVGGPAVRGHLSVPSLMEFTFYRKDRLTAAKLRALTRTLWIAGMSKPNPISCFPTAGGK